MPTIAILNFFLIKYYKYSLFKYEFVLINFNGNLIDRGPLIIKLK